MSSKHAKSAKEWWAKNVNNRPAWRVEELPHADFKDILVNLGLAYEIRRGTVVLGKPDTQLSLLFQNYFWEIVSCVLKPYQPYVVTGIGALAWHLGSESLPKEIAVLTKSSSARIELGDVSEVILEKQPAFFQQKKMERFLVSFDTGRSYPIPMERAESLLVRLRPQYLRDCPQLISAFLKAVDFNAGLLKELLQQQSRPIVYLRLAHLFEQVGKNAEASMIRDTIKQSTPYAAPGKALLTKFQLPSSLAVQRRISDQPYVTRFRDQLRIYADRVNLGLKKTQVPSWSVKKLLAYAEKTKRYDTYHSSTIEGYRVTPEEIQALIDGKPAIATGATKEEIERKMALKGYLEAHRFVLESIAQQSGGSGAFSELIIREIYAHLFSPSVEAGLSTKAQLTCYRNDAVFIRNSRHVPPNHHKVDELMRCLVEEVSQIENTASRALLAHYGFVTVHPYFDGNGRVGRFLMNYLLSLGGVPWVTIRVEDRDKYFQALQFAQCDEDIEPFIQLLKRYFEEERNFEL